MQMVSDSQLLISAGVSIALIVVLIVWGKLNPFLSLMLGSGLLAMLVGVPLLDTFKIFADGFGKTLGGVGILIALGAIIGNFLVKSGAADTIVDTFLAHTSVKRLPWMMALMAFIIGIPLFFEVGIVLLIPVIMMVARRAKVPVILVGIPALAGLSALHGLVPPHPGPLIAIDALNANLGFTLGLGLLVAVPVVALAGPISARYMARWVPIMASDNFDQGDTVPEDKRPSFGLSLSIILLPVILMLLRTLAETIWPDNRAFWHTLMLFLGEPLVALLLTTLACMFVLGNKQQWSRDKVNSLVGQSFGPIASILLIVGAGGGFKETLVQTGVADAVGGVIQGINLSPILAGWAVAVLIRLATGSATVATITAAGIMTPLAGSLSDPHVALLVLAIGAGSVFFSHVNDAGFWMVKEYFGMTIGQTIKTWSLMETILSVSALIVILALSLVI